MALPQSDKIEHGIKAGVEALEYFEVMYPHMKRIGNIVQENHEIFSQSIGNPLGRNVYDVAADYLEWAAAQHRMKVE